jgi:hypothetical protein
MKLGKSLQPNLAKQKGERPAKRNKEKVA